MHAVETPRSQLHVQGPMATGVGAAEACGAAATRQAPRIASVAASARSGLDQCSIIAPVNGRRPPCTIGRGPWRLPSGARNSLGVLDQRLDRVAGVLGDVEERLGIDAQGD